MLNNLDPVSTKLKTQGKVIGDDYALDDDISATGLKSQNEKTF